MKNLIILTKDKKISYKKEDLKSGIVLLYKIEGRGIPDKEILETIGKVIDKEPYEVCIYQYNISKIIFRIRNVYRYPLREGWSPGKEILFKRVEGTNIETVKSTISEYQNLKKKLYRGKISFEEPIEIEVSAFSLEAARKEAAFLWRETIGSSLLVDMNLVIDICEEIEEL